MSQSTSSLSFRSSASIRRKLGEPAEYNMTKKIFWGFDAHWLMVNTGDGLVHVMRIECFPAGGAINTTYAESVPNLDFHSIGMNWTFVPVDPSIEGNDRVFWIQSDLDGSCWTLGEDSFLHLATKADIPTQHFRYNLETGQFTSVVAHSPEYIFAFAPVKYSNDGYVFILPNPAGETEPYPYRNQHWISYQRLFIAHPSTGCYIRRSAFTFQNAAKTSFENRAEAFFQNSTWSNAVYLNMIVQNQGVSIAFVSPFLQNFRDEVNTSQYKPTFPQLLMAVRDGGFNSSTVGGTLLTQVGSYRQFTSAGLSQWPLESFGYNSFNTAGIAYADKLAIQHENTTQPFVYDGYDGPDDPVNEPYPYSINPAYIPLESEYRDNRTGYPTTTTQDSLNAITFHLNMLGSVDPSIMNWEIKSDGLNQSIGITPYQTFLDEQGTSHRTSLACTLLTDYPSAPYTWRWVMDTMPYNGMYVGKFRCSGQYLQRYEVPPFSGGAGSMFTVGVSPNASPMCNAILMVDHLSDSVRYMMYAQMFTLYCCLGSSSIPPSVVGASDITGVFDAAQFQAGCTLSGYWGSGGTWPEGCEPYINPSQTDTENTDTGDTNTENTDTQNTDTGDTDTSTHTIWEQLWSQYSVECIAVALTLLAIVIQYFWNRNKKQEENPMDDNDQDVPLPLDEGAW